MCQIIAAVVCLSTAVALQDQLTFTPEIAAILDRQKLFPATRIFEDFRDDWCTGRRAKKVRHGADWIARFPEKGFFFNGRFFN